MKRFLSFSKRIILMCVAVLIATLALQGQNNPNEVSWSGGGFYVKKVVSNTTIQSGVNFSYTIIFSAPAGTPAIPNQMCSVKTGHTPRRLLPQQKLAEEMPQ